MKELIILIIVLSLLVVAGTIVSAEGHARVDTVHGSMPTNVKATSSDTI